MVNNGTIKRSVCNGNLPEIQYIHDVIKLSGNELAPEYSIDFP